ncbi:hypothetical protein R4K48_06825 [Brachyspira pulli]|uniref:hypothetical protein n=1 Tax=Brachyspira pulli TaxID=310721 RepID=UPI00260A64CB|nr:hypothetical protein [uncultured Brachyspira sp.]
MKKILLFLLLIFNSIIFGQENIPKYSFNYSDKKKEYYEEINNPVLFTIGSFIINAKSKMYYSYYIHIFMDPLRPHDFRESDIEAYEECIKYTEFCLKNISVEIELGTTFYYIKNIMMDEFGMTIYIELEDIIDHPYSEDFDI